MPFAAASDFTAIPKWSIVDTDDFAPTIIPSLFCLQSLPPVYKDRVYARPLPRRNARHCHLPFVRELFPTARRAAFRLTAPASFQCCVAGPGFPFADRLRTPQ